MSNRDPDAREETLNQGIPFFGDQLLKRVHTCLPGIVQSYNAATRRARVQPAVDLLFTDGTSMEKPVILDVPVLFFTGNGFTAHTALTAGDAVQLLFSERDIARFKETLETGPPLSADIMEIQHAVALPGFVPPGVMLSGDGMIFQSNDGMTFLHINNGTVDFTVDGGVTNVHMDAGMIRATPDSGTTLVELQAGQATITAAAITITGVVTATGNMDVTGDIGVTGTVDGVDVSTHTHNSGSLTSPMGGGSVSGSTGVPS